MSEQDEKYGHEEEKDDVEAHHHKVKNLNDEPASEDDDSGDDVEAHHHRVKN